MTFWDKAILVLLGGLLGVVLKWLQECISEWWNKPRLKVDFNANEVGFKAFTPEVCTDPHNHDSQQKYKALYVSDRVTNVGRKTATNCRGFLVRIEVKDAHNQWMPTDYCDSVPLQWSYRPDKEAREGISIPTGVDQFLNVLSAYQEEVRTGFRPVTVPPTMRETAHRRF